MGPPAVEPKFKRHDRSGLTLAERNAIIFYARGAKEAAARALGWTNQKVPELGSAERFIERQIVEIQERANRRNERRIGATMRTEKGPDRLDEREAEPAPPPGEKLDERIQEVPPPSSKPPVREDEPDDAA
jgi:hypothetical protein